MDFNFTEKDLQEVAEDMGYAIIDKDHLRLMKEEIDKYICDDSDMDESLFTSLSINGNKQNIGDNFKTPKNKKPNIQDYCKSPIVSKSYAIDSDDSAEEDLASDSDDFRKDIRSLIGEAYKAVERAYKTCHDVESISSLMESLASEKQEDDENMTLKDVEDEEVIDENEEEQLDEESEDPSTPRPPPKPKVLDPSLRPVLQIQPGRAPYRFDPVTRYHLYKEEWARHPAPGELRRLSIRWKVREYMLHHDIPKLTGNPDGKVHHPKEWSPKPYLD